MTGPSTELDDFERVVHEHAAAAYRVAVVLVGEPSAPGLLAEAVHEAWRRGPAPRDPARVAPGFTGSWCSVDAWRSDEPPPSARSR